jgi:hypothetical protein
VISTVYRCMLRRSLHTAIGKSSVNEPLDIDFVIHHNASRQIGPRVHAERQGILNSYSVS